MSHEPVAAQRAVLTFATVLAFALGVYAPAAAADLTLNSAVGNPARSAKFVARDKARHPLEELTFFWGHAQIDRSRDLARRRLLDGDPCALPSRPWPLLCRFAGERRERGYER